MVRTFLLVFALSVASLLPAHAAKRALVIGNNAYSDLPNLQKAVADAEAYQTVLTELGYTVRLETDLPTLTMQQVIGEFVDIVEPGDEVAFVYAGHGWSDGSTNYVIGSDTPSKTSVATLRRTAVPLRNGVNGVIDDLQAQGARVVLAVVDACRNNPFESKLGRSGSVGLSRGLVLVAPVSGTFTVFSAGVGEEALDRLSDEDEHPNSVFSRVFLTELAKGGSLQDIVLDTAPQVADLADQAGHQQRPAYYDGIGQRYCLTNGCDARTMPRKVISQPEPEEPLEIAHASPEPTEVPIPQTAVIVPVETVAEKRGPLQFIVRNASPVREVDELKYDSICSVNGTPIQTTLAALVLERGLRHHNRSFPNLQEAVRNLDGNKCNALAVGPSEVSLVLSMVRDRTRYIVLPEVVE